VSPAGREQGAVRELPARQLCLAQVHRRVSARPGMPGRALREPSCSCSLQEGENARPDFYVEKQLFIQKLHINPSLIRTVSKNLPRRPNQATRHLRRFLAERQLSSRCSKCALEK